MPVKHQMCRYLIGADPELFLVDKDGQYRSAHNVIPGSKEHPCEVLSGAIQVDGVAAEFNINPAETAKEFVDNIRDVLTELAARIETKNPELQLIVNPTATFDKHYFRKLPQRVKMLGCTPDYNVYTGHANPPPATKEPMRTGGGHIHIGWSRGESVTDGAHLFDCAQAVKQLDSVLYPMSLLWDNDDKRRSLYGTIGTYRPKHYGVEYRPLSNAWVADPDLQLWIFNTTKYVMECLDSEMAMFHDYFQQTVIGAIKNNGKPGRSTLLEYHDYLVEEYLIPALPEAYTRVHQ